MSVPAVAGTELLVVARRTVTDTTGGATLLAADPPRRGAADELTAAVALAAERDAAIVVVGTTDEIESEGFDRTTLALPGRQDELVRAAAAANPATVVVVNSGGPVELPWRPSVPAVLLGWFPGEQAGHGLADVLFGAVEPGGRLPTTWPVTQADVPVLVHGSGRRRAVLRRGAEHRLSRVGGVRRRAGVLVRARPRLHQLVL